MAELALYAPDRIVPDRFDEHLVHHLAVIAEYDDRVLRVVVNNRVSPVRIVTLYFDRKLRGTL